jgi:hypothetical protein
MPDETKSKKPKTTHVPYQHEHIQYEPITPDFTQQIQAVWRIMLGCNPRFNKYFNTDGTKDTGINDGNYTTGGVAKSTGKDYSYDAYKAYQYDYATVTLKRMAFAFWSLNPEGPHAGLYAWANSDIEPLISDSRRARPTPKPGDPKKDSDPTPAHCRDVYLEAYALYCEWLNLANFKDHILAVFLVLQQQLFSRSPSCSPTRNCVGSSSAGLGWAAAVPSPGSLFSRRTRCALAKNCCCRTNGAVRK